ncbi:tRNA dihydrouridine synthase DusB [candidate division KSB1 bacterium]|nr:tRNA dihydrouridine synthase DusB [candidate division KSB1 bacterium]
MFLGQIEITQPAILAPLAGISDSPFRSICREFGAGLVFTEMVSADGLVRGNQHTWRYLYFEPAERPIGIQLFGNNPESMARAAEIVSQLQPDFIDINMGCPVPKVIKHGAGAALLKDLPLIEKIVRTMRAHTTIPILAKIRSGWEADDLVAVDLAQMLAASGVAGITVHPRTRSMNFTGHADWNLIRLVKQAVQIPVIGNGDVTSAAAAQRMFEETGCDLVMIGRGAFGNPWLFREIALYLKEGRLIPPPTHAERIAMCLRQFRIARRMFPERYLLTDLRKHLIWYTHGLPQGSHIRQQLFKIKDVPAIETTLLELEMSFLKLAAAT